MEQDVVFANRNSIRRQRIEDGLVQVTNGDNILEELMDALLVPKRKKKERKREKINNKLKKKNTN
jgi:hypothetical protein